MIIRTNNRHLQFSFQTKFILLVLLGFQLTFPCYSQTATSLASSKKALTAEFLFPDVEYEEMAVISNVLKVKNNNVKEYTFTINMSLPGGWRTLNKTEKKYTLAPNDSLFVPIRLLTNNKAAKGGTKYDITIFIATEEGRQMAIASFLAGHPKISNWQMHILPRPRIYFLNHESTAPFQINLSNDGDEEQQVLLSMNKIGKDFIVSDTTGKFLKKNYMEFTLPPFSDTLVPFSVQIQKPQRNVKRIDTYGYMPDFMEQEKHYGLFLKASEVGATKGKGGSRNKKIDFVKLANSMDFVKLHDATRVNPYGSSVIPVTMIASINNILGQQPIMNVVFYGTYILDKKSRLDYSLQTGFTYYKYTNRIISGTNGVISYYHEKGFVSVGSGIGLNFDNLRGISNGKGIAAGYRITPNHTVGAYFLRNGLSFLNNQSTSFGAAYAVKFNSLRAGIGYDRTNYITGIFSNGFNANISYRVNKNHNLGALGQYTLVNSFNTISHRNYFSLYYNANYLKGKGNSGLNFTYREGTSGFTAGQLVNNNTKDIGIALTNSYHFKNNLEIRLTDNYNIYTIPGFAQNNTMFNNILTFALPPKAKVNYTPGIYLNYSNYFAEELLSSGLQLSVNTFNMDENFRMGFFVKGGYNKLLNYPELGTFFTAQTNSFLSYRTWNLYLRYFYGPQGLGNLVYILTQQKRYPQAISGSLSNQYQFKNKHFIWENTVNYNYTNVSNRHSMGLFTQLFYFTNGGWSFNINAALNYNISESYKYTYLPGATNNFYLESSDKKNKSKNLQLGVGIKKDFGIPIPKKFRKKLFCNANFKVFLDINGNKKFDADEIPLENIVIRMNEFEVLSNEKGEASFINIGLGKYNIQILPLVDIGAWFAVVPDSMDVCGPAVIYIPFSKGVQILGNVQIDREKFSSDITEKIDISRIKIFLVDSLGKVVTSVTDNHGNFKFYVPYGKYILKFDEKILGASFELTQNDIPVELSDGVESYYHTFYIIEKKRKVVNKKFGPDGNVISEGQGLNSPVKTELDTFIDILLGKIVLNTTLTNQDITKIERSKINEATILNYADKKLFGVQILANKSGLPKNVIAHALSTGIKIESYKDKKTGIITCFLNGYQSLEQAQSVQKELLSRGVKDAIVISFTKDGIIPVK